MGIPPDSKEFRTLSQCRDNVSKNAGETQANNSRRPGPFGPAWAWLPKEQPPLVLEGLTPATDGNFTPMPQWGLNNWPTYIHLPREIAAGT